MLTAFYSAPAVRQRLCDRRLRCPIAKRALPFTAMRIALTHNLRLTDSVEEAEFDAPETIDAIAQSIASAGHDVERIEVSGPASRLVARLEAYAPDLIFNSAEGRRGKMRRGFYPALFEQLGIPSTGSDAYALCVTLDKALTKK